jgi:hypothetical protein
MDSLSLIITLVAGLAALLFGRRLFWLFVGLVGFLVSFNLATEFLSGQPQWVILLIALLVGIVGALLAVFLQYIAVAVAGFMAGGYAVFALMQLLNLDINQEWLYWFILILGGVIGAILILLVFDWALIILSAGVGAATLVQLAERFTELSPALNLILFFLLLIVGIAFQAYTLPAGDTTTRRRIIRRRVRES